jgi:hypothetical protein
MAGIIGNQTVACQGHIFSTDGVDRPAGLEDIVGLEDPNSDPPHHRRCEIPKRRRAKLRHGGAGLGAQDAKHALDAGLTEGAKSPKKR